MLPRLGRLGGVDIMLCRLGAVDVMLCRLGDVDVMLCRLGGVDVLICRLGAVDIMICRLGGVDIMLCRLGAVDVMLCRFGGVDVMLCGSGGVDVMLCCSFVFHFGDILQNKLFIVEDEIIYKLGVIIRRHQGENVVDIQHRQRRHRLARHHGLIVATRGGILRLRLRVSHDLLDVLFERTNLLHFLQE